MKTPELALENAVKHHPAWKKLWSFAGSQAAGEAGVDCDLLREAFSEAWIAGHQRGEQDGYRQAAVEGGDEGFGI